MISLYFGATKKGKSWHVLHHVLAQFKRAVIFDPMGVFDGDLILTAPTPRELVAVARKMAKRDSYRVVIRTTRSSRDEVVFGDVVTLASLLGRILKAQAGEGPVPESEFVQVVVDEASTPGVCSSSLLSRQAGWLACKGRHDCLDSHWIAQNPMALHNQVRAQATKVVSFFLNSAGENPFLVGIFKKEPARRIEKLPSFHRLEWRDSGEVEAYGPDGKMIEKVS